MFPNGTITIHSVTDKDGGDYLCVARNKMGDDYILLRVNVLTRPAKIKQKQQQSSQEVIYGGDLKVDCVASGLPYPEISWALPDGTMVNPAKGRDSVSRGRSRRYKQILQFPTNKASGINVERRNPQISQCESTVYIHTHKTKKCALST